MVCRNSNCIGHYDFDHISDYAIQRFVEGHDTIDMLGKAKTAQEIEEICLVCLLDVDNDKIGQLELSCQHGDICEVTTCREQLREMIEYELKCKNNDYNINQLL